MTGDKVVVIFVISLVSCVYSIEEYCSINNYNNNDTYMQFTKEPNVEEFALVGKFKSLHCCAKNYRSIEWYKNGKPYPWPVMMSQLILYPESANQTVYTQAVTEADEGNYTCVVKNDTVVIVHYIVLKVFEQVPDDLKITFMSESKQVPVGQTVRFFCEAFAGQVDLPDARNEAIWSKVGSNQTLNTGRIHQEKISREEGQTFGTYLTIENVQKEDYGRYSCQLNKPGKSMDLFVSLEERIEVEYLNPNPFPVQKMLVCITVLLILCLTLTVLNMKYGLEMRVRFKDNFGSVESNDGKDNDALILYSDKDSDLAFGVFLPTLENNYNYKCACLQFPENIRAWNTNLRSTAQKNRRIIALLSPHALSNDWDSTNVYTAIKELCALGPQVTCVCLANLPVNEHEAKNSEGETLKSVLRLVHVIQWNKTLNDEKLWLDLCLRMPAKRGQYVVQANNSSRLTTDSQESLDNLV